MPMHHNSNRHSWQANHPLVQADWTLDERGKKQLAALQHVELPLHDLIQLDGVSKAARDAALRALANDYIAHVHAHFPLGEGGQAGDWLLHGGADGFGWLAITWGEAGATDPRLSFWSPRDAGHGHTIDRCLVLMAGNRQGSAANKRAPQHSEGLAVGLRVVMAVGPSDGEGWALVRILGLSASRLHLARGPDVTVAAKQVSLISQALAALSSGLGLDTLSVHSVRLTNDKHVQLGGSGQKRGGGDSTRVFEWASEIAVEFDGVNFKNFAVLNQHRGEQASHAWLGGFRQDPMTCGPIDTEMWRRPTRESQHLNPFREALAPVNPAIELKDPNGRYEVRQSKLADAQAKPDQAQQLRLDELPLRGDGLAAFHAWLRAQEFFERLDAYGVPTTTVFKAATTPLVMRHHAWFFSQPDGLTVNAQVRPDRQSQFLNDDYNAAQTPRLEVRFGHANLSHREVGPLPAQAAGGGPARAQTLGLAADPRWAWHEFGHVLSAASTGALEFHFVHSVGDALAAIIGDPASQLACRGSGPNVHRDEQGGRTFPWVPIARRHDREAALGWCWCGQRNRMRRAAYKLPAPLFKAYVEEQMLSSAMFRLYRALGGDSFNDGALREAAADYCVYLVMRAFTLLGSANVVPVLTPDAWVLALKAADTSTLDWTVSAPWHDRAAPPRSWQRRGGTAHKVLRWAFEQQGLYAADDLNTDVEGVGRPPPVDLYVPGVGARAKGDYAPVSLAWAALPQPRGAAWHVGAAGIARDGGGVQVRVRNRGHLKLVATGVTVRAWAGRAGAATLNWHELSRLGPQFVKVPVGRSARARFAALDALGQPLHGKWLILADVNHPSDPSNLNPDTWLPCSASSPPTSRAALADLVANDNNLGLRVVVFP